MDPLTEALAAEPPAAVQALPDDVRSRLAEQVLAAQRAQQTLVAESVATALRGVPLPVRGLVKKALGA